MKKRLKRTISLVLASALLLALLPAGVLAAGVEGHWAARYIQTASDNGWISAEAADPDAAVTRAEAAEILGKALGSTVSAGEDAGGALTRQDAIVMLAEAFGLEASDKDAAAGFSDWADVADSARDAVAAAVEQGIVNGVGGSRLAPTQAVTLGELVKMAALARESAETGETALRAGAGNGEIVFSQDMFPVEGFNGVIHDNPYARVLLLDDGTTRVAIAAVELVNIPADGITLCQQVISEKTGTPIENVWVHATHAITTPHGPSDEQQLALYMESLNAAITEAAEEAMASFQPAVMGIGTGTCDVNANRDIEINGEQYYGLGSTEPSNKTMTIVRFDGADGSPIGFFISYGIKPTAIDNVEMSAGTRQISSDVPGLACRLMEEEFGAPALFCMPAAGDQIPKETTMYYELKDGEAVLTETSVEDGLEIVDRLGTEMGETAIEIAESISAAGSDQVIGIGNTALTATTTNRDGSTGEVDVPVSAITLGDDLAFVGFQPELNCTTELELWDASPYAHTLLVSFLNGENKYMPDEHAYDVQSWEYKRTSYERGTAEKLVSAAAELLESMKSGGSAPAGGNISADDAIAGIETIGFVDNDGAKLSAIVVEYAADLSGAEVSTDTFEVYNYGISQGDAACEIGSDPGKPVKAYVNDKPEISAEGGSGTGSYVIIEVNTDYQLGSVCKKYLAAMAAGVKQVKEIVTANATIAPSSKEVGNYVHEVVENVKPSGDVSYDEWDLAKDGTYTITNIAEFQLFTKENGTAFHATNCFEEATGEYVDVDLPYALYVPADYDASKEYALVIQVEDAGFLGDDPMITLTESQACANFASEDVQQIVKDAHGLAGIIVVSPQISEALRSTRDNWSLSAAVPATWQLLDSLTEKYNINMDHIYGTGQSMGGMQIVAMAAQRDNYFAGIWANGCQWGSNYDLEDGYNGATYYETPVDGVYVTGKDADGNEVDYRNWYYMVSDDNILITNCAGDAFSTQTWKELDFLYHDLAGTDLIYENYMAIWNPLTTSVDEQNAAAKAVMEKAAAESDLGFVWTAFEGGDHMATWIYSHAVFAHYEWLLTQSRDAEMERGKLECLTNNFEYAEEQDTSAARELAPDADGNMVYYATGKLGAGTADYNGCWLKMGTATLKAPNWKPGE